MPLSQVANVAVFDFGAPAVAAAVVKWRVKMNSGGKLELKFENTNGENDLTVSVQVSADNVTYAATTAGNNLAAVTNAVVVKRSTREFEVLVRRDVDLYVQIVASGPGRGNVQVRGDSLLLEPIKI